MPLADVERDRSDVRFRFAHVGYEYNIEELGIAMQLGVPLQGDKALAARRAYREFMWNVALFGSTVKGMEGLANQSGAVSGLAPADGTGAVTTWFDASGNATKTPAQIVRDFNGMLVGIYTGSLTVEMADTVLLPYKTLAYLAATPFSAAEATPRCCSGFWPTTSARSPLAAAERAGRAGARNRRGRWHRPRGCLPQWRRRGRAAPASAAPLRSAAHQGHLRLRGPGLVPHRRRRTAPHLCLPLSGRHLSNIGGAARWVSPQPESWR
jgi:hypothetical protein